MRNDSQRLQEQGIHPSLGKLIYLTKGEFEFFKGLRERFLKRAERFLRRPKKDKKESSEKPVERRSLTRKDKTRPLEGFIYGRDLLSKNWHRVTAYYQEITAAERYEKLLKEIKT